MYAISRSLKSTTWFLRPKVEMIHWKTRLPAAPATHSYGGNPEKRKALRQLRDYWWSLMDERRAHVTEAASLDDSVEISKDSHAKGALHSRGVAIYHVVFPEEDFSTSAHQVFALVRATQEREPNKPRHLFLSRDTGLKTAPLTTMLSSCRDIFY